METKIVKLKEALAFAKENGYVFAVYHGDGTSYLLHNEAYLSDIDEDVEIIVNVIGEDLDFREFTTKDKKYYFKLHNNFQVAKIVPIF